VFYGCWSVMIFNGFATSVGFRIPTGWDLFAAWLSKMMPIVDRYEPLVMMMMMMMMMIMMMMMMMTMMLSSTKMMPIVDRYESM
jgi:hypothetical protein